VKNQGHDVEVQEAFLELSQVEGLLRLLFV